MTQDLAGAWSPMRLPWRGEWIPHAVVTVSSGCNITCSGCYNGSPAVALAQKPLALIEEELDELLRRRHLHSVTLSGGEPTLHRELPEIVAAVRRRSLKASILSNGRLLGADLLERLRAVGTSAIIVHVERGQRRDDLPAEATPAQVWEKTRALTDRIAAVGMTAGVSLTVTRSGLAELPDIVQRFLETKSATYLLLTAFRDLAALGSLEGSFEEGFRLRSPRGAAGWRGLGGEETTAAEVALCLRAGAGLLPVAFLPGRSGDEEGHWLSYLLAVLTRPDGRAVARSVGPTAVTRVAVRLIRRVSGRYLFFHVFSRWKLRLFLATGSLFDAATRRLLPLVVASFRRGSDFRSKHVILEDPPRVEADGSVDFCRECPDPTLVNGRLVPICLSHLMSN